MAAIAASNIQQINFNFGRLDLNGFPVEMYRIFGAFAAADTATFSPNRFKTIKSVIAPGAVSDISTIEAQPTQVVLTMRQSAAAGQSVDVILVGHQRN